VPSSRQRNVAPVSEEARPTSTLRVSTKLLGSRPPVIVVSGAAGSTTVKSASLTSKK
jgi:hypothetical protein